MSDGAIGRRLKRATSDPTPPERSGGYFPRSGDMVPAPYPSGGKRRPGYPTSRIDPTKRPVKPKESDLSRTTSRVDPNLQAQASLPMKKGRFATRDMGDAIDRRLSKSSSAR